MSIQYLLGQVTWKDVGGVVVLVCGVITGVGATLKQMGLWGKKARAKFVEEIRHAMEPELKEIKAELSFNGGGSTKDKVTQTVAQNGVLHVEVGEIRAEMNELRERIGDIHKAIMYANPYDNPGAE